MLVASNESGARDGAACICMVLVWSDVGNEIVRFTSELKVTSGEALLLGVGFRFVRSIQIDEDYFEASGSILPIQPT